MPEFADHSITVAIPVRPSVGWFKRVAHEAGVWPDDETVPDAIWNAVMRYQVAMVEVAEQDRLAASAERAAQAPVGAVPAGWKPTQQEIIRLAHKWYETGWNKAEVAHELAMAVLLDKKAPTAPQAPESKDAQP